MALSDIAQRVRALGHSFDGRIDQWRIDFALEYIDHGELPLAFETLCTYIHEHAEALTLSEYRDVEELAKDSRAPLNPITWKALWEMVPDH